MSAALTTPAPARLKLYQLPAALAELDALIDALDGELPEDLEARLDALELNLEEKADAVCALARQAEAEAAFFADELARLDGRRRAAAGRAAGLKAYLHRTLTALGRDRVETPRFRARVQKNGTPSVRWAGPGDVPDGFARVTVELDGRAALAAHKAGTLPEGFTVEYGTHLRIS